MKARIVIPGLLIMAFVLVGCGPTIPLADLEATLTAMSPTSSGLDFGSMMSTALASIPKALLEVVPDPVYYGSGCSSSEPTNIYVTFTETSELLASLPVTSKGSLTSVAYQFHSPTTLPTAGGETKYVVSLIGVVGSFHIFPIDLSAQTFDGTDGWIDVWVETEVMTMGSGSGGGLSISTAKVFESKPLRIVAKPCPGGTPTATDTSTPAGFDYSGELQVVPDIVYGGPCPTGAVSADLIVVFRPAKSPDVAKPPVPVKYFAVLDFTTASGAVYPSVVGEMSWYGPPTNYWFYGLPLLLVSWPPPYEKGLISVAVLVKTDEVSPVTVYHSGIAQIPFAVCAAPSLTPSPTITDTPVPTVKPAATRKPTEVNEPPFCSQFPDPQTCQAQNTCHWDQSQGPNGGCVAN